jgi:hypothetical protein
VDLAPSTPELVCPCCGCEAELFPLLLFGGVSLCADCLGDLLVDDLLVDDLDLPMPITPEPGLEEARG